MFYGETRNFNERRNRIIGLFTGLFKKMSPVSMKPKAVAFVDFEHWYISLSKMHGQKPDYKAWYAHVCSKFDINEIYFFADFSNQTLGAEIPRIREITNFIIETQNSSAYHKKDYTDFIMLDHIYQRAMTSDDVDTFIIFSGDGHFSSVVNFLCLKKGRKVGIYAVRDAASATLKSAATWTVEVPIIDTESMRLYRMILRNLRDLQNAQAGKKRKARPAFWPTVDAVAKYHHEDREEVADALRGLIEKGYVFQTTEQIGKKSIKVINVNWDKVKKDGVLEGD